MNTDNATDTPPTPPAVGAQVERGVGLLDPERWAAGMPDGADERYLRRLLARYSGIPHIYWDDGEAQGQQRGVAIDFMREPVADIDAKLMTLALARLEPASATANQETTARGEL